MSRLEAYSHAMACPVPTVVARALVDNSSVTALILEEFEVESLPAFAEMRSRLAALCLGLAAVPILFPDTLSQAPITVAASRRLKLSTSERNYPTPQEQFEAAVGSLAPILADARNLELLSLGSLKEGSLDRIFEEAKKFARDSSYPQFPQLERLRLSDAPVGSKTIAFKKLLATSPKLTHIDLCGVGNGVIPSCPTKLENLQSL